MKRFMIILSAVILFDCTQKPGGPSDTPTSGSIKIAVDESLRPLFEAEISAFQGIYHNASITPMYVPEAEAVQLLIADSVRLAVITRSLTTDEKKQITDQKISPHESKVAREGIALIVNKSNNDTLWDMEKVKRVLSGNDYKVVFDNNNSGIARVMQDSILKMDLVNAYAVQTNKEVIDYVTDNPNSVGFIGASWISDKDDSLSNHFLESIRVVGLEHNNEFYQPYQAYIAQRLYPLTRSVVINSREPRSGLGTGFTSFVAGDKGQRIVLKAGLVPVTMPVRIVQITKEL
ncbi:MAG TPA: substrate-binding domain-containing protein [Cyclobacteriaceae bacterium]|nr:substrate-binding domain-containing protein [Cyclobacteriaceae bacterium]